MVKDEMPLPDDHHPEEQGLKRFEVSPCGVAYGCPMTIIQKNKD